MLETVGVEPPDEEAYRALLSAPGCDVRELAGRLGRDEHDLTETVGRLEKLGLLTTTSDDPVRLLPTRPDVAVDALVAVRRAELDRVRAEARVMLTELRAQEQHRPENLVEVIVGQEAIAARFAQLLNGTGDQLLVLDRPPYASRPGDSDP
jgi:DNA-binding MarR family transcriptional regulator